MIWCLGHRLFFVVLLVVRFMLGWLRAVDCRILVFGCFVGLLLSYMFDVYLLLVCSGWVGFTWGCLWLLS